ncbi:hypothetical protein PSDVSF_08860 [Pseudodesulfovibrio sediminis]|uniref:DUF4154 domain-containing protein n=2 Tax=Pseudodesulfovibrio sediminis TaxID=2810563 RepID=A0ABM7P471_9BACT|nr:hypothetical protein PSDVSF_08860 [Pseudodesulfovibrio sediminis]
MPATGIAGGKGLTASVEQLQALFVQRLVRYVQWPAKAAPHPDEPIIIAATNARCLRPYFAEDASGQRFKLVQWPVEAPHVLVVNGAPSRESAAIMERVATLPILTIGQSPTNLKQGVVVNFRMVGGKVKLQINPAAAEQAGLTVSSRLLRISQIYKGGDNE